MGYGNQIKAIREEKKISRVELANMISVNVKTMYNYENEITKISSDNLEKISNILGYNFMSSNLSNKDNKNVQQSQNLSSNKPLNTPNLKKTQDSILINIKDDTVYVPFFKDGAVSAGFGTQDFGNDCDFLPFKKQDLRLMFGAHSTAHIGVIPCIGNSMQPTIEEGELIVFQCDGSQNEGAIYVIRFEGELFVKRLKKRPLQLVSDNKDYKPIEPQADQELEIIGRVIGSYSINSKRF